MSLKSLRTALNAPATAHESRGLVIYPLGCDNHALPDAASACAGRSGDAKLRLIRKLLKQHALAVGRKLGGCTAHSFSTLAFERMIGSRCRGRVVHAGAVDQLPYCAVLLPCLRILPGGLLHEAGSFCKM